MVASPNNLFTFYFTYFFLFLLVRASTCFMGVEDQNIALSRPNTCLMGEKNNRFHVLVRPLWAEKKSKNACAK